MKRAAIIVFTLLVIACPALFAGNITLSFDPYVWQPGHNSGITIGNEPIGPYQMKLTDANGSTSWLTLWCMTYNQSPDWNAFTVEPNTTGYGHQAWILSQLPQNNAEIIQWALWITSGTTINGHTAEWVLTNWLTNTAHSDDEEWINKARNLAGSLNTLNSGYVAYRDVSGKYQSMIHLVPEPGSTLLLLGIAFIPTALSYRRWKK